MMEIRARIHERDMSDPLEQFYQVELCVAREDGKRLSWLGGRVVKDRADRGFPLEEAIASAVEKMLLDTTVLEFVGMLKVGK